MVAARIPEAPMNLNIANGRVRGLRLCRAARLLRDGL
jgi:hypothetical protein